MPKIIFNPGTEDEQEFNLDTAPVVLGTDDASDIPLEGEGLAPRQARFAPKGKSWTLENLGANDHTRIDDTPLKKSATLSDGQRIALGDYILLYRDEDTTAAAAAVAAASDEEVAVVKEMSAQMEQIRKEVAKVIIGQVDVLQEILMSMVAGGHALLVGMPGMAKTTMVATIAKVLDMEFKRVQFTPDLMPTDISGTEILATDKESGEREFRFIKGPIFTNLLLADEINRTPPKTQAALLEAMQEHSVTVGNTTYKLPEPFFVLATQNPVEQEGTYPLPEAQLDRFMFCIWLDYPGESEEEEILAATTVARRADPQKVLNKEKLLILQDVVRKIPVSRHVIKYAARLVRATRPADPKAPDFIKEYVSHGAGPRAGQFLILAAKARAILEGRIHISCKDIHLAARPVLRHRMITNFAADSEGLTTIHLIDRLVKEVPEPSEKDY